MLYQKTLQSIRKQVQMSRCITCGASNLVSCNLLQANADTACGKLMLT